MNAPSLLRAWRERNHLTQEQAAEMIGVDQATWSNWENNKRRPGLESALKIEKITAGEVPVTAWLESEDLPVSA